MAIFLLSVCAGKNYANDHTSKYFLTLEKNAAEFSVLFSIKFVDHFLIELNLCNLLRRK